MEDSRQNRQQEQVQRGAKQLQRLLKCGKYLKERASKWVQQIMRV
jgi:hypothetical protein